MLVPLEDVGERHEQIQAVVFTKVTRYVHSWRKVVSAAVSPAVYCLLSSDTANIR